MTIVYLTVGFPGSGKSTWSKAKAKQDNVVIINLDSIREMLKADYVSESKIESVVKKIAKDALHHCMDKGFNIIIDQTNLSAKTRAEWVGLVQAEDSSAKIVAVCFTEMDSKILLDRRMTNPRGYKRSKWAMIISNMKNYYTPVGSNEGFNETIMVDAQGNETGSSKKSSAAAAPAKSWGFVG